MDEGRDVGGRLLFRRWSSPWGWKFDGVREEEEYFGFEGRDDDWVISRDMGLSCGICAVLRIGRAFFDGSFSGCSGM